MSTEAPHDCDGWDSCPNPAHKAGEGVGLSEAEREALTDSIGAELYASIMESSADGWRRWEFMTDAAKEKYRVEGARIMITAALPAVERIIAARVQQAEAQVKMYGHLAYENRVQTERAESAAAERDALRERVEALVRAAEYRTASSLNRDFTGRPFESPVPVADLRAALDGPR